MQLIEEKNNYLLKRVEESTFFFYIIGKFSELPII